MSERVYPVRPLPENDDRFTRGVALDVAEVLVRHGYPPVTAGRDFLELQRALYRFLYVGGEAL